MIGVMKPQRSGSGSKDHWNSYCASCKMIGNDYGQLYRMGVNFDLSMVATIAAEAAGLTVERTDVKPRQCFSSMELPHNANRLYQFIAALHVFWYDIKLHDQHVDDDSRAAAWFRIKMHPTKEKALKRLQDFGVSMDDVSQLLENQSSIEQNAKDLSPDDCAQPTAQLAALFMRHAVIAAGKPSEERLILAEKAGFNMGKALYLHDACMDLEKDHKYRQFNPFLVDVLHSERDIDHIQVEASEAARYAWQNLEQSLKSLIGKPEVRTDCLVRIAMVRELLPGATPVLTGGCQTSANMGLGKLNCRPDPALTTAALATGLPTVAAAQSQSMDANDCGGALCGLVLFGICCLPILYGGLRVLGGILDCICNILCCFASDNR